MGAHRDGKAIAGTAMSDIEWTNKTWKNPETGMVYAFSNDYFTSLMWPITGYSNNTLLFGPGGWQAQQASHS